VREWPSALRTITKARKLPCPCSANGRHSPRPFRLAAIHHDPAAAFPQAAAKLYALKLSDAHFRKLSDACYELVKVIHRAETGIEPTSDQHLEDLTKQRLTVPDAVADMVAA
jgi:uncharacterized protein YdcH (DUF465 family)